MSSYSGAAGGGVPLPGAPGAVGGGVGSGAEEARFDLAAVAGARERVNRPVALVIAAAGVLVVAVIGLIYGLWERSAAAASFEEEKTTQQIVRRQLEEYQALERQAAENPEDRGPASGILSRISQLGTAAGLRDTLSPPSTRTAERGQLNLVTHTYAAVRDPSLAALMEWMRQVTAQIPGVEIDSLRLIPDETGWLAEVTYRRWERRN